MRCLTSGRFNMRADLLRQGAADIRNRPVDEDKPEEGNYVEQQDPLTHEIVRVWVPASSGVVDDPSTPDFNETTLSVPCIARGVIEGGIRVAGTAERFGVTEAGFYENVDYVRIWFPASHIITNRDRVTNIRNKTGQVLWRDEETGAYTGTYRSTMFEVAGVTPVIDPFGNHIENFAMLQKVDTYAQ